MTVWAWVQPVDRIWKVVTDPENGTIEIYNEKNDLIDKQKDLNKSVVLLIEENFLGIVATRLINSDQKPVSNIKNKKVIDNNPMYA